MDVFFSCFSSACEIFAVRCRKRQKKRKEKKAPFDLFILFSFKIVEWALDSPMGWQQANSTNVFLETRKERKKLWAMGGKENEKERESLMDGQKGMRWWRVEWKHLQGLLSKWKWLIPWKERKWKENEKLGRKFWLFGV